jgi:hypothetical protein
MNYQQQIINAIFSSSNAVADDEPSQAKVQAALDVYKNNYIETGIRALEIGFSTLHGLMDENDFRRLAAQYLQQYPKTCFDWADYGEHLSDFILEIDALAEQPFLSEVADLDWRLLHIERSNNAPFEPASFGLMQTVDPNKLVFTPAPGLQIMQAIFPLDVLYQNIHNIEHENEEVSRHAQKNLKNLLNDAIKSAQYRSIVLWREQYKGVFEYCDATACKAFESMLAQDTVAQVLGHFQDDQDAMTQWLQSHIASKKIVAVLEL